MGDETRWARPTLSEDERAFWLGFFQMALSGSAAAMLNYEISGGVELDAS
jgi:hypothetical protein